MSLPFSARVGRQSGSAIATLAKKRESNYRIFLAIFLIDVDRFFVLLAFESRGWWGKAEEIFEFFLFDSDEWRRLFTTYGRATGPI